MSYEDIKNMPIAALNSYLDHLETRRIETKIMMTDVIMLPTMKYRDPIINKWIKHLDIQEPKVSKTASPAKLKMMGIGVRYVK